MQYEREDKGEDVASPQEGKVGAASSDGPAGVSNVEWTCSKMIEDEGSLRRQLNGSTPSFTVRRDVEKYYNVLLPNESYNK